MSFTIYNGLDKELFYKLKKMGNDFEIIDAIITDPPYNISRENNFSTINRQGIDFGPWDYNFDQEGWIEQVIPLLKDGGSIIIFNDYKNIGQICKKLESCGLSIKDLIWWKKNNPMPRNTSRRYVTDFEVAIWAVKPGAKWTFNKSKNVSYLRPEFKHPIVSKKTRIHPTQKNVNLLKDLIKIHTNKGDVIMDPFMGSGVTGVAAMEEGRSFIGSEADRRYFNKANKWLIETHTRLIKEKKVLRSPLYYQGDKYKLLPQLIDHFPKNIDTFVDLFGGGGTMLANIKAHQYIYNEVDNNTASLVKYLYSYPPSKIIKEIEIITRAYKLTNPSVKNRKACEINELNKEGFKSLRDKYNEIEDKSTFKAITMLLVLVIYGFNSQIRFNSNGKFNIPNGKQDLNNQRTIILKSFVNSIRKKQIIFLNKNYKTLIETMLGNKSKVSGCFLYADPPYSLSNTTYNTSWSTEKDKELFQILDVLNKKGYKWALSNVLSIGGRVNLELDSWRDKYYTKELDFSYDNSNYQKKKEGKTREILVTNYAS